MGDPEISMGVGEKEINTSPSSEEKVDGGLGKTGDDCNGRCCYENTEEAAEEEVKAAKVDAGKNNKDDDGKEKGEKKRKGMDGQEDEILVLPSKKMKETLETNNPIAAQAMAMTLLQQQQIQQKKMALAMMNNQGMNNQMMNNQVMNNQMMKNQMTMMDPVLQWWRMHEVNVPGVVNPVLAAQADD